MALGLRRGGFVWRRRFARLRRLLQSVKEPPALRAYNQRGGLTYWYNLPPDRSRTRHRAIITEISRAIGNASHGVPKNTNTPASKNLDWASEQPAAAKQANGGALGTQENDM